MIKLPCYNHFVNTLQNRHIYSRKVKCSFMADTHFSIITRKFIEHLCHDRCCISSCCCSSRRLLAVGTSN
ncbi:hypothetical protein AQUCO_11800032v1 [Aquilegia coerulea]|uniref:Uncharacterized protein n=1 Tax=Aquilegia coerulea TaxID=218851 RepID=A0A2G5C253_AQUCA|nr:hypothetical protein AQUCO_11800032v1 [Aquilegia coerulea]